MAERTDWPASSVLAELPPVAKLRAVFAPEQLEEVARRIQSGAWLKPRRVTNEGVSEELDLDWTVIPIRSIGGDPTRPDPGGPASAEFADTHWRTEFESIDALLNLIPAPFRAVRLMALAPGASSPLHTDTECGLPWGYVRLHIPIVTSPAAVLILDGAEYRWQPGEWWYADFTRPHIVENHGDQTRVHLVMDCRITPELLEQFPDEFHHPHVLREVLFDIEPVTLDASERFEYLQVLSLPPEFFTFDEFLGQDRAALETVPAAVVESGADLSLHLESGTSYGLVPLGNDEFRLAGWTRERTIRIRPKSSGGRAVLVLRNGSKVWEYEV